MSEPTPTAERLAEVLLVDDNPVDLKLAAVALRLSGMPTSMSVRNGGDKALEFLRHRAREGAQTRNYLVLLDLNMPLLDGVATLQEIRNDPVLASTPVVMLTTSGASADVQRSRAAGANGYIRKPIHLQDMIGLFWNIEALWSQSLDAGFAAIDPDLSA